MAVLIKNAMVYLGGGMFIPQGDILIEGDKISAVGPGLTAPDGAELIDAKGLVAMPGIVDPHTHVSSRDAFTRVDNNESTKPCTPEDEISFAINPDSFALPSLPRAGVTTMCVCPGSANVICGMSCILKPVGGSLKEMMVKDHVAMKAAMGGNPKGAYGRRGMAPMTRMGVASILKDQLTKAKNYVRRQEEAAGDPDKMPPFDLGMEHMAKVIRKEIPLKVHSYQFDNLTVLRICKEFDVNCTIDHAFGADTGIEDYMDPHCLGVIYGPMGQARKQADELRSIEVESAIELNNRGVNVAIMTDGPSICTDMLFWQAGEIVRHGGGVGLALDMLTIKPARMLGIDDRVGSLDPGKDADVALFSAIPALNVTARCVRTIINGKTVYAE